MEVHKNLVFDKLFKVSPIGINIIDLQERQLIQTSFWAVSHIGYTEDEFLKLSHNLFEAIVHPDDRQRQLDAYNSLMTDPSILFKDFNLRFRKKNNDYIPVLVRLSVLEVDENQKPITCLNTAMDISEIVELRERLDVELRKLEIISYKNSHQLRGPVATILGLVQLMDHESVGGCVSSEIINALKSTVMKLDSVIGEINEHAS